MRHSQLVSLMSDNRSSWTCVPCKLGWRRTERSFLLCLFHQTHLSPAHSRTFCTILLREEYPIVDQLIPVLSTPSRVDRGSRQARGHPSNFTHKPHAISEQRWFTCSYLRATIPTATHHPSLKNTYVLVPRSSPSTSELNNTNTSSSSPRI